LTAKYRSCRSVTAPDTKGGTLRWAVHSQSSLTLKLIARVGALR